MSRLFTNNTANFVTVPPSASINNLAQRTAMVSVNLNSFGVQNDMAWLGRGTDTFFDISKQSVFASHYAGLHWSVTDAFSQDGTAEDMVPGTWTHLAVTHDSMGDNKLHIFINGVELTSYASQIAGAAALVDDSLQNLLIGGFTGGNVFTIDGKLYDFRLYNSILTAPQIQAIRLNGHTYEAFAANKKCHLTFAADLGSTETDASGNGNDGFIGGASFSSDNPQSFNGTLRTPTTVYSQISPFALVAEWDELYSGAVADWFLLGHYNDKCIHVYGTFGGATVTLEGSNEDHPATTTASAAPLTDPTQTVIQFTTKGIRQVLENPLYIRPAISGGTGNTDLKARLVCRT